MKNTTELLAPGGDIDSIKAAILAGADAVYCGLDKFNARRRATNIKFDDLYGILHLAHKHNCKIFLTLNIIILENEIPVIIKLLNKLVNTSIDGIIIQDWGVFYLISRYFKSLKIHASTQLTTHNKGQIKFLAKLNAAQVNLSRELNIEEISELSDVAKNNNMLTEVFVHGSYCISFSGICYMSSVVRGKSGNRGECSQPCREKYIQTPSKMNYPLNLKDNSAFLNLDEIVEAGVDSIKIEGRIKKFDYVYTVVKKWREQIQYYSENGQLISDKSDLFKVFNRDFSNGYLTGKISKDMFIDNPRDNSLTYLSKDKNAKTADESSEIKTKIFKKKNELTENIKNKIDQINIKKLPLKIEVSGQKNNPLKVKVITSDNKFELNSDIHLCEVNLTEENYEKRVRPTLDYKVILSRFKAFNKTAYFIENFNLDNLDKNLYLPFREITSMKNQIISILNNCDKVFEPGVIPPIKKQEANYSKTKLAVLISSIDDLNICKSASTECFFQLPASTETGYSEFLEIFQKNDNLFPWFPSILIGKDFTAAVDFLHRLNPQKIVTNNTGIAYEAKKNNIPWIAGPSLNITNSYSLLCLKENFNCMGSFISNEIDQFQINRIQSPENFKLYYSIYHPIVMMTSRQCLFQQVTGCGKNVVDRDCIINCEKHEMIKNLDQESFFIEKSKGNYHEIYHQHNFFNLGIIEDIPNKFSAFLIDLRNIETATKPSVGKTAMIQLFENMINGDSKSKNILEKSISFTTNAQYKVGL